MSDTYCVKCKRRTGDVNPAMSKTKNGKTMQKSTCSVCGCKKCQFVASTKGAGVTGKRGWVQGY